MATKLKSFEFKVRTGKHSKHDWNTYLDGTIWQLTKGEDYTGNTVTMVVMAKRQCEKRGLTLHYNREKDEAGNETLILQAVAAETNGQEPQEEPAPAPAPAGKKGRK